MSEVCLLAPDKLVQAISKAFYNIFTLLCGFQLTEHYLNCPDVVNPTHLASKVGLNKRLVIFS